MRVPFEDYEKFCESYGTETTYEGYKRYCNAENQKCELALEIFDSKATLIDNYENLFIEIDVRDETALDLTRKAVEFMEGEIIDHRVED